MFWRRMSSPPRTREREEERRVSLRTLAIASIASATAALITSQFWAGGTPIAAAVTPVIVTLVSELLHRPTEAIARRVTVERTVILPEAGAAAPPAKPDADKLPDRAPSEPGSEAEAPIRVYGRQPQRRIRPRGKVAVGVVVTTAVLAFAIAAAALTLPELITGNSIGKGDRHTTLFGGRKSKKKQNEPEQQTSPTTPGQTTPTTPEQKPQATTPTQTTPTTQRTAPTTTQTTPKNSP
jgi:hypothetical protein